MYMLKKLLFLLIFLVSPVYVSAHGTNYLEFNPDQANSLKDSAVATPAQMFFPQNDFLGGFDIYVANPGSSGTAIFDLISEQGNIVATKTVSIPNIPLSSSGTRLHVDLNSQVPVLAYDKYMIRLTTSMPELRLYYSDRVQLVAYNSPFVSEYTIGVARLGTEEQAYSFKYALYETTESSAPIISNAVWTEVSQNQMRLSFNANEPVDFKVDYGISGQGYTQHTNFTGGYTFCTEGVSLCDLVIDVLPNSTYQYTLTVKDSWGNQSQATGTFDSGESQTLVPTPTPTSTVAPTPISTLLPTAQPSTPPPASPLPSVDPTLPIISNLRIVDLTDTNVSLAWTTNRSATSHLLISTPYLITVTDTSDSTLELEHLLGVYNLGPNVNYVATVTSIDSDSHSVRASLSFTTLRQVILPENSPPPPPPPPIQNPFSSVTDGGNVEWVMPTEGEPEDGYRVDIFDKEGNLIRTINLPSGTHNVSAGDLGEGEYTAVVYTNNDGVFEKVSQIVQAPRIQDPPFLKRLLAFWWALIPLLGGLGYMLWRNRANTSSQTPQQPVV